MEENVKLNEIVEENNINVEQEQQEKKTNENKDYNITEIIKVFNSENVDEIDINDVFSKIKNVNTIKQSQKLFEAEEIIKKLSYYIDVEDEQKLYRYIDVVRKYIKKYDIEKEENKNISESEFDKIYAVGREMINYLSEFINNLEFTLVLSVKEMKMILHILNNINYKADDILNFKEIYESHVLEIKRLSYDKNFIKTGADAIFKIDIKKSLILYHFINKFENRGINENFYVIEKIINKLFDINNLFNAINVLKDRLNSEYNLWSSAYTNKFESEKNNEIAKKIEN